MLTSLHNNEPVDKTYEPLEQVLDRGSSGSCFHIRDAYMFFFFFKMALSLYCGILFRRAINLYSDSPTYHVKFHDLLQDVFILRISESVYIFERFYFKNV